MVCLGDHYWLTCQYPLMIKYYMMAIENNSSKSMYNLAWYYKTQYDMHHDQKDEHPDMDITDDDHLIIEDFDYSEFNALAMKYFTMTLEHDIAFFNKMKSSLGLHVLYDIMNSSEQLKATDKFKDVTLDLHNGLV